MAYKHKAGEGIHELCQQIMEQHYPELVEAGLTVEVHFAYAPKDKNGLPKSPAVTHHGKQAAAKIKKNSQEERANGAADVRIILDGDRWQDWSDRRQVALLDHELRHVELIQDQKGAVKLDDSKRPLVRMKQHDLELGVFLDIMERYGEDAIDTTQVKEVIATIQKEFDFKDETPSEWFKQG